MLFRKHWMFLYVPALLFLFLFPLSLTPVSNPDIGFHLKTGEWIYRYGFVPEKDIFSFTFYGEPWLNEHWLAQLIFYAVTHSFGLNALVWLKILLVFLTFFFIYKALYVYTRNAGLSCLLSMLSAFASRNFLELLPLLFTFLFFSITVYLYYQFRKGWILAAYVFPILFFVWAELHAGFVAGLAFLYLMVFADFLFPALTTENNSSLLKKKVFLFTLFISTFVWMLRPDSISLLSFTLGYFFRKTVFSTDIFMNWQRTPFFVHGTYTYSFLAILFPVLCAFRRRFFSGESIVAAAFLILSFTAVRHIPLYCMACMPFFSRELHVWIHGKKILRDTETICKVITLSVGMFFGVVCMRAAENAQFDFLIRETYLPKDAARFLKMNSLKGNMFNHYDTGGYLIWKLAPDYKVFVDGRANTVYTDDFYFHEYLPVVEAWKGWDALLRKYKIRILVLRREVPLVSVLMSRSDFQKIYEDFFYVVFIRKDSGSMLVRYHYPRGSYFYFQKANDYYLKKDYRRALFYYRKSMNLASDIPVIYHNMAVAYLGLGNKARAREAFKKALQIYPDYISVKQKLKEFE